MSPIRRGRELPPIDLSALAPLDEATGEDDRETEAIRRLSGEARSYLVRQPWCRSTSDGYYGTGLDDKLGVFLFRVQVHDASVPEWIWVVAGDLPPLYIGAEDASTAQEALDGYVGAIQGWIDAVQHGGSLADAPPVDVEPTREHAEMLASRQLSNASSSTRRSPAVHG